MMKRTLRVLALGTGLLMAATLAVAASAADQQALFSNAEILPDRSILSFDSDITDRGQSETPDKLHRLVALPPDATRAEAFVLGAGDASARILGLMRGLPVALLEVDRPAGHDLTVELRHDGDWSSDRESVQRRHSRGMDGVVDGSMPRAAGPGSSEDGSYLILTVDTYLDAIEPLVDWKREKGFDVRVATPAETGYGRTEIQAWLRNAYATWETPPEYLMIVGDVADIPTWDFSGNPTDHPYTLMNEGDWLPDLFLGRLSVENDYQARTAVNKTVNYEKTPHDGSNGDWYRRYLGVAGNAGSETPVNTVKFCGQQLQSIGFENSFVEGPYDGVYMPPWFGEAQSVPRITNAIDGGVSMVVYRGWAYGVKGWEPPHFITNHIDGLNNGPMTPIVMSFVCLNGDYSVNSGGDVVCFGEVWTRAGTPSEPKGAVAFIGNGEHWSHTRYNDAMAISYYERITDPAVTTLGGLSVAGRLRFMDYFPHQLDETGDEASVEFYMHIYNLLGDPELNFWKATPTTLDVVHEGAFSIGASDTQVSVSESGGGSLAGARVGIVQDGELLACAYTDVLGEATLVFARPIEDEGDVVVTVTHPDRRPYQATLGTEDDGAFLAATEYRINDADGLASPGEAVELYLTLTNAGTAPTTNASITIEAGPEVVFDNDTADLPDLEVDEDAETADPFLLTLDGSLEDGQLIYFDVECTFDGGYMEGGFHLPVSAPSLSVTDISFGDPGHLAPGEIVEVVLTVSNTGSVDATDLTAGLVLTNPNLGTITDGEGSWGAIPVGGSADNAANSFLLQVAADVPHGTALPLTLEFNDADSYHVDLPLAATAGLNNPAAPIGPDGYGYYAYDNADLLYSQRPAYEWVELSPLFGGTPDTTFEYSFDNQAIAPITLPFDFVYYGQTVNQLLVSDNGWVSFDTTPPAYQQPLDFYNWGLPNQHGNHSIVAPFYDNLTTVVADSLAGSEFVDGVYAKHDAGAGTYRVEWSRMRHYRPEINDLQTFQLVLYDPMMHPTASGDGEIGFFYRQVNNADTSRGYATLGMEDHTETDGLQLSYASVNAPGMAPIGPGLAVRITTEPPSYEPFRLDAFTATPGETGLDLSWESSDERPVIGWHLRRVDGDRETFLAELPAGRRHFEDANVDPATDQVYRLTALHPYDLSSELGPFHSLAPGESTLRLSLGQSLPNPMRESARIDFVMPRAGKLSMKVYDTAGRLVRTLADGPVEAGPGSLHWDGKGESGHRMPAGVYFYRLSAEGQTLTRKLMVLR